MSNFTENNQGKNKRKRSVNWDSIEKGLLKNCMKEFVEIIENKNTDTNTNKSKAVAWQTVAQRFNEFNNRERDIAEIKQQWRTLKLDAKKNLSQVKASLNRTGGGPKPPSPSPATIEILNMIPQEFETDFNVFDSDGIDKQEMDLPQSSSIPQLVINPIIDNTEYAAENTTPITNTTPIINPTPRQRSSGMKRKLTFNDVKSPKHWDKEFAKERNHVLLTCIKEEHRLKMESITETQKIAAKEHSLKISQMIEVHNLFKEESQLRIEKLKLEISKLKSDMN